MSELAKGHAWKACKAERPRGFESRSLRHTCFQVCCARWGGSGAL